MAVGGWRTVKSLSNSLYKNLLLIRNRKRLALLNLNSYYA